MRGFAILTCLFGASLAYYLPIDGGSSFGRWKDGGSGRWLVSRRDETSGIVAILSAITELLGKSCLGINDEDLHESASKIQALAEAYLETQEGKVSGNEAKALISEIAATLIGSKASSTLLHELSTDTITISQNAAFSLLKRLAEIVKKSEASDQARNAAVAAIGIIVKALNTVVVSTDELIKYREESVAEKKQTKRYASREQTQFLVARKETRKLDYSFLANNFS